MPLQSFYYRQKQAIYFFLRLLLLITSAILPTQLYAYCHVSLSIDAHVSAEAARLAVADDCHGREQAACRRVLHNLSMADTQLGYLSGSLSLLHRTLTRHHALFKDAVYQLSLKGILDRRTSAVDSLKDASSSVIEIVGIHIAIASVRSEMIMANHDLTTASIEVRALDNCVAML